MLETFVNRDRKCVGDGCVERTPTLCHFAHGQCYGLGRCVYYYPVCEGHRIEFLERGVIGP